VPYLRARRTQLLRLVSSLLGRPGVLKGVEIWHSLRRRRYPLDKENEMKSQLAAWFLFKGGDVHLARIR
jgi:hypothetical protein